MVQALFAAEVVPGSDLCQTGLREVGYGFVIVTRTTAMRDMLLHIDTYPEPTSPAAIDAAIGFAAALGGRLSAVAVHIDIRVPHNRIAEYLIGISRLAEEEEAKCQRACVGALKHFSAAANAAGVLGDALTVRADMYLMGERVAELARTRDICLVPVADRLDGQRSVAEAVVFESARPTIVYSPGRADLPATGLDVVVLAWDGSRCAARAMADALPILAKAKTVKVLTIVNEKAAAVTGLGADAVRHLRAHGVNAVAEEVDARGRRIGDVMDEYVVSQRAGLLVMGAYGRSRVREFILGGATEHVLNDPKVAILLSH